MRGLLATIVISCVTILLIQYVLARQEFNTVKNDTAERIRQFDWKPAERHLLQKAMERITYANRFTPTLIFASAEDSIIAPKLESAGVGPHIFMAGWLDLDRRVDAIRIGLTNGQQIDYQIDTEQQLDKLYCHASMFLGPIGIDNGAEIESVSLIGNGALISETISPIIRIDEPTAE